MRIVLDGRFIQDHFPGIARYTFNLARALGDVRGDDEVIVLIDPTAPNRRYDLGQLPTAGGVVLRPIRAPVFGLAGLLRLGLTLRDVRPDVFHSPYVLRSPFFRGPSVVTVFDLIAEHPSMLAPSGVRFRLRREFFRRVVGLAVRTSTRVIVPSRATAKDLAARHHQAQSKIRVIPLGVDPIFRPAVSTATAALREHYHLPEHFILCVGINKPHKNLLGLVRCLQDPRLARVSLVSAGPIDSRYRGASQWAQACGLSGRVMELGAIPDSALSDLYSAAEVLVCPSFDEGFGLTPLEAMACGTPVVSSNRGSLPEVVGDAGILVDPTDQVQLAGAIRQILDDPLLADRLRAAGFRQAAKFTWANAGRATIEVYREVVRSG